MAEINDVPDFVQAPESASEVPIHDAKLILPVDESDQQSLPVALPGATTGLHAFLNEKHIAMLEQLLYKSGDTRIDALYSLNSVDALVDFLAFSDIATLKHFFSLADPVARAVFVQGLHHPAPVPDALAPPSTVMTEPAPVSQETPVENTTPTPTPTPTPPMPPVASEEGVVNEVDEDQQVDDHQLIPAIGAMMMDPGDGDDIGEGGGEADAGSGYGGDGIGPDPEAGGGDLGETGGEVGGETGGGEAGPGTSESGPSTASETPATETPAGQTTGETTPTQTEAGTGRQFDSSSPEANAPSEVPGQVNSIRWEEDDPVLQPATQTVTTTTEAARNLTDMALDFFDPPAADLVGAGSDMAMPTVGSFLRTMANGAAALIVAGGVVAASFFFATYSRHSRSSRDGNNGGNGGHDSDPSHALADDGHAATDNAAHQAGADTGLAFDAAAFIAQLRQLHADGAMDPRLDDPAFLELLGQLGAQIIADLPQEMILPTSLDTSPAATLATTAPDPSLDAISADADMPDAIPAAPDTPDASPVLPAPISPPDVLPPDANAPANDTPAPDPTPPAVTLYLELALVGADASRVREILDAAGNHLTQNAPGLLLHVAGFELVPELRLAANAALKILVNMEVRTSEAHASGGHISMSDLQQIIRGLHAYCADGSGAVAQGLHLAFMGLDVMSGVIAPDSEEPVANATPADEVALELTLIGVPAMELASL